MLRVTADCPETGFPLNGSTFESVAGGVRLKQAHYAEARSIWANQSHGLSSFQELEVSGPWRAPRAQPLSLCLGPPTLSALFS